MRGVLIAAVALSTGLLAPTGSQAQIPIGAEFQVAGGPLDQAWPSVAVDPQGGFIVTWSEMDAPRRLLGRRYDAAGNPVGADFTVSTFAGGSAYRAKTAADASGAFVVVWMSYGQDGDRWGVFGRRFDAAGTPLGPDFPVNTTTAQHQYNPSLAVAPSGRFVVGWQSGDFFGSLVFAQAFDAAGSRVGAELRLDPVFQTHQSHTAASMNATGDFIVVWADRARRGIYGRRYDAAAQPAGAEFRVSTNTLGSHTGFPSVARDASGDIVVAWQRWLEPPNPGDPDYQVVHTQRLDPSGVRVGAEYQEPGFDHARYPQVAVDPDGRAALVWTSTEGTLGVFKRAFDSSGRPVGPLETVSSMDAGSIAMAREDSARTVIAWHTPDFGSADVWARRYDRLHPAGMVVDNAATPGSDGNGVFEAGETVTVAPSWRNPTGSAVGAIGGSASAFTGPGAPNNPSYAVVDGTAAYGALAGGATVTCLGASPDCYRLSISAPTARPATHWHAAFDEQLTPQSDHGRYRWTLHVGGSFGDVPRANPFYRFVETLLHHGVTGGCGGAAYCPSASTTREQMAVFVIAGREGTGYLPPACAAPDMFTDVPQTSPFCRWIEELSRRGVVAGCGPGLYCPTAAVSREQMAVFALRTLDPTLNPPSCVAGAEQFGDVPASSPFCRWIEELARRGIVGGCGGGLYCPAASVTREQMAVFIALTFGLALYGP